MIAFVFGVIAFSIFAGSILNVSGSISTNTGFAPTIPIASDVATNVNAVEITSSPAPISKALKAKCKASVPEFKATVCLTPIKSANSCSKALLCLPKMYCPERKTSKTSFSTSAPICAYCLFESKIGIIFFSFTMFLNYSLTQFRNTFT